MGFKESVEFTLSWEGGLVDDPLDIGGVTSFGISQRAFPELNVRSLTREQAIEIYRDKFWTPVQGDQIHPAIAFALFDFAVNSGVDRSVKILQQIIGATVDGDLGPKTLAAINALEPKTVLTKLQQKRGSFLIRLVAVRPDQRRFIEGWSRRVIDCSIQAGGLLNATLTNVHSRSDSGGSETIS